MTMEEIRRRARAREDLALFVKGKGKTYKEVGRRVGCTCCDPPKPISAERARQLVAKALRRQAGGKGQR